MENQFTTVMSERSDEQLIQILTTEREKYTAPAIEAAEKEIEKRNIAPADFSHTAEELKLEKDKTQKVESNSASSVLRFVNYLVDIIAGYLVAFVIAIIISIVISSDFIGFQLGGMLLIMLSFFAYYILMEITFPKTLGKFITKTKVVKLNGEKPKEKEIVLRTFCRLIPFDHISFLFGGNGFHDKFSKTKVIKDKG